MRETHKKASESMGLAFPRPDMRLRHLVDCYLRVSLEYTKDYREEEEELLFLLHLSYFSPVSRSSSYLTVKSFLPRSRI